MLTNWREREKKNRYRTLDYYICAGEIQHRCHRTLNTFPRGPIRSNHHLADLERPEYGRILSGLHPHSSHWRTTRKWYFYMCTLIDMFAREKIFTFNDKIFKEWIPWGNSNRCWAYFAEAAFSSFQRRAFLCLAYERAGPVTAPKVGARFNNVKGPAERVARIFDEVFTLFASLHLIG